MGTRKVRKGKPAQEILAVIVPGVIASISFPKTMRWREGPFKFSRPIKNILCLFDGKVLPFSLEGMDSNDTTSGHPIYSPQPLKVKSFQDYRDQLKKAKVIVDPGERRKMILGQIEERLASLKARIYADDELLERLSYNVEYPCVILGAFPEKYLSLPIEVLATAMREGQKLFSVVKDKKQLPCFLGVADAFEDSKSLIRKGNERVLKARLEDARFFWEQDIKKPLAERAAGLKNVVFQEKLGTYDDKAQRLKKIVGYLSERTDAAKVKKEAVEAAGLCKADLLTEMVKEFPSLQGKMGGLYAKAEGYPAAVHQAIYEHYQPVGPRGRLAVVPDRGPGLAGRQDRLDRGCRRRRRPGLRLERSVRAAPQRPRRREDHPRQEAQPFVSLASSTRSFPYTGTDCPSPAGEVKAFLPGLLRGPAALHLREAGVPL